MQRAYRIHLERIEAHDRTHQDTSLSCDTLQVLSPDDSCRTCYPATQYHRRYRSFWAWYQRTYPATSYTQKTVSSHLDLITNPNYITARLAAREIVFSCRYRTHIDPRQIIINFLTNFTPYRLTPTLPLEFPSNIFDPYIEDPDYSPPNSPIVDTSQILRDLGSPVSSPPYHNLDLPQLDTLTRLTSVAPLELEPDDNFAASYSSLPPYDENTTPVIFPLPSRHNFLDPLFSDIPLTSSRSPSPIPGPSTNQPLAPTHFTRLINFIRPSSAPIPQTPNAPGAYPRTPTHINTTPIVTPLQPQPIYIHPPYQRLQTPPLLEVPEDQPTLPFTEYRDPEEDQILQEIESDATLSSTEEELNLEPPPAQEPEPNPVPLQAPEPILEPPPIPLQNNMANQALNAAANAMTALANALGTGGKKSLIKIDFYRGDGTQDPITWLEEFKRAARANNWSPERQLALASAYMKDNAQEWLTSLANAPTHFDNAQHGNVVDHVLVQSFTHLFKNKFNTTKQKATWQKQLFEIKQGPDTIDTYVSRFKQLQNRVDPTNLFPATLIIQFFVQGLRPEYAVNVQASEPATLAAAITEARRWETGRLMASENKNDTHQAIERLTEQIAKLSINLVEKQPTKPVYYTDNKESSRSENSNSRDPTCYYCGNKGHFIRDCRARKEENRKSSYNTNSSRYDDRNPSRSDNRYSSRDYHPSNRSDSRNRNRSRDRNYNQPYHNNRSRSRSQSCDRYRSRDRSSDYNRNNRSRSRSSTPYPRNVYTANTTNDFTYEEFETFLANDSIRTALASYMTEETSTTNQKQTSYTTPVKCNIRIRNRPYQAIIDSGAAISMISYQVVKELGLKIEAPSTSLIVSATGPSTRPLGIIKDLPVNIEGIIIPIDVEVMSATSYSLLLGNDWSQKVDATYSWKNKAYTIRWNKKKIHVPTTYEQNQPLPAQPTLTDEKEFDQFEQEYLTPKEAYIVNDDNSNPWITPTTKHRRAASTTLTFACNCKTCNANTHLFADCPDNQCRRCHCYGHISAYCPMQAPKRNVCKTCNLSDHLYRNCPDNRCHQCYELGHIGVDCPLTPIKLDNQRYRCGCSPDEVNDQWLSHYTCKRTHHCCYCKVPQKPEDLKLWNQALVCKFC